MGREEVIALAQKGMDYEVIRGQWDAAQGQLQRLAGLEAFLQELAQPQNMTVEDLMDSTRAQVLAEREGLDLTVALQRVKLDRERREFQAAQDRANRTQQEQARQAAKRQDGFLRFAREYPQVDPKEIPKEVWDQFGQGADLTDAYARWENKKLRQDNQALQAKLETAEKNAKNKERSTGSQQSAGQAPMDELDRAWYDGT